MEKKESGKARPFNRTTSVTVSERDYLRVSRSQNGVPVKVEFCNDVVSSARGGASKVHHFIRRYDLLVRQFMGGYVKVNVRTDPSEKCACLMMTTPRGNSDDCSCYLTVIKA